MDKTRGSPKDHLLSGVGVALLGAGVLSGWLRAQRGNDFAVLRAMATGVATNTNVYLLNAPNAVGKGVVGMVYPPATAFVVLPLAFMSYELGRAVWFLLMNAIVVLGIRAVIKLARPTSRPYVWLIGSGLVLFCAAVRWGMMLLQGAPFMLGLLCLFVCALHRGRPGWASLLALVAAAFKMTLALPFIGLLLLHRRVATVGLIGAAWLALNAIGFFCMGAGALATYRHNVQIFEAPGVAWNINGPDPWLGVSLPRLDWVFLFYGVSPNFEVARIANVVCTGLVALWLLREGLRVQSPPSLTTSTLFLTSLVCLGSLCVYHHQYDLAPFLAPMLLLYFYAPTPRWSFWPAALGVPLALIVVLLPIGAAQHLLEVTVGSHWVGLLKLSFPVALTLALLGSLVLLRRHTRLLEAAASDGSQEAPV